MNISLKYFDYSIKVLLNILELHCNSSKKGESCMAVLTVLRSELSWAGIIFLCP